MVQRTSLALVVSILWVLPLAGESLHIGTFNIRSFSAKSRDRTELTLIANELVKGDLWVLQELRDEGGLELLVTHLDTLGRGNWEGIVSPALGRGSKERYGFLYRIDKVMRQSRLLVSDDPEDLFIREPAWMAFRAGEFTFVLGTVHILFGSGLGDRRNEVQALKAVVQSIQAIFPQEDDFILGGDFNLSPLDHSFEDFRAMGWKSVNTGRGTTIRDSPYDTFWLGPGLGEWTGQWDIIRFDEVVFGNDDTAASRAVSDHRPVLAVFMTTGEKSR